jgi:hypothetical protein
MNQNARLWADYEEAVTALVTTCETLAQVEGGAIADVLLERVAAVRVIRQALRAGAGGSVLYADDDEAPPRHGRKAVPPRRPVDQSNAELIVAAMARVGKPIDVPTLGHALPEDVRAAHQGRKLNSLIFMTIRKLIVDGRVDRVGEQPDGASGKLQPLYALRNPPPPAAIEDWPTGQAAPDEAETG